MSLSSSKLSSLSPRDIPAYFTTLYHRAPASILTISSLVVSYLANAAYLDYRLYQSIGTGGLGKPTFIRWLFQTLVLRPLSMSDAATKDPNYLPLDDIEWDQRIITSREQNDRLDNLPIRSKRRPEVYGFVPHRQIEFFESEGSAHQEEIISHLQQLAERHSSSLTLALSTYEADKSPALYVTHHNASSAKPTRVAELFLSGNPPPKRSLQGVPIDNVDVNKHELAHIHHLDGSLHIVLSPQDARKVIQRGWGELHPLAGLLYRGYHFPPYWLPHWFFNIFGGQSQTRWAYLQRNKDTKSKLIPPTYCLIYAPNTAEQIEWTKAILDSTASWCLGQPL